MSTNNNEGQKIKITNPEGEEVELPLPYRVFFVKAPHWRGIFIWTKEHIEQPLQSPPFLRDGIKKPKWAKKLLNRKEIYHIDVRHHTIEIYVMDNYLCDDVWDKIEGCLKKELLNRLEFRIRLE